MDEGLNGDALRQVRKLSEGLTGFDGSIEGSELADTHNQFLSKVDRRIQYEMETEARRRKFQERLLRLQHARELAMRQASQHAGNLGLVYKAATNSFVRIVIVDDIPSNAIERPRLVTDTESNSSSVERKAEAGPVIAESSEETDENEDVGTEESRPEEPGDPASTVTATAPDTEGNAAPKFPEIARPTRPAPIPLPQVSAPSEVDSKWEKNSFWKSLSAWIASILVGLFVGYGLLTLTGLPYQRGQYVVNLYLFLGLGVGMIAGMKLLFDAMWHESGRQQGLGNKAGVYNGLCFLLSLAILIIESGLGGQALVEYTKKSSYQNAGALPLWQMMIIAAAVSSANLLYSAFIGYQKGVRSITTSDLHRKRYAEEVKHAEALQRAQEEDYEKELKIWEEACARERALWEKEIARQEELKAKKHEIALAALDDRMKAHEAAIVRWESETELTDSSRSRAIDSRDTIVQQFESYRNLPDYQALCTWIGIIDSINLRISEVKKASDNDSISRGHSRKNVT